MDDEVAVRHWLQQLKLEKYAEVLLSNEFDTLHAISEITEADLSGMNINKIGARRKLLSAAAKLRVSNFGLGPADGERRGSSQSLPVDPVADSPPFVSRQAKSVPSSASKVDASRQREADRIRKLQERLTDRQRELANLQAQLVEEKARAIVKEREVLLYIDSQKPHDERPRSAVPGQRLNPLNDHAADPHETADQRYIADIKQMLVAEESRPPSASSVSSFALSVGSWAESAPASAARTHGAGASAPPPPPPLRGPRVPSAGTSRPQSVPPQSWAPPLASKGRPSSASGQRPHHLKPLSPTSNGSPSFQQTQDVREAIENDLFPPIASAPGHVVAQSMEPGLERSNSIGNEDPTEFINAILTHLDSSVSAHSGAGLKSTASASPHLASPLEMNAQSRFETESVMISKDQLIGLTERGNNSLANAADTGMDLLTEKIRNRDEFTNVLRKYATPSLYALTGRKATGDSPLVSFQRSKLDASLSTSAASADTITADGASVLISKADYRKLLAEQEQQHAQLEQCDLAYRKMLGTFEEQQEYLFNKLEALASPVHSDSLFLRPKTLLEGTLAC